MTRSPTGASLTSGCACHPSFSSLTPRARNRCAASRRSASRSGTVSVAGYQRSARSQSRWPAPAADDGDLAVDVEGLQHAADVPAAVPAMLVATVHRPVLELAREQRAPPLELAQDIAPEGGVLLHELPPPAVALEGRRAPVPAHEGPQERERLDRIHERVELDEPALLPQQPVELGRVEVAEAAPEDEVLRRRDGRDRVELEEAEPPNGVQHPARRAVEQLRAHRDPPGVREAHPPRHGASVPSRGGLTR